MALELYRLFAPELKAHLDKKEYAHVKGMLGNISPIELSEGWHEFNDDEKLLVFRLLSSYRALYLFECLDDTSQDFLIKNAFSETFDKLVEEIDEDNKRRFFHPLPSRIMRQIESQAKKLRLPIFSPRGSWPANTAGSLMSREYFCVDPTWKAKQTLERLQATARLKNVGDLHDLYVTDKEGRLLGAISIRTLIAAPSDIRIQEIMWPVGLLKVRPESDQEEVMKLFDKYDPISLPVVDGENKIIGVIMIDDVLNVMREEATEDIAKMGGTAPTELTNRKILDVVLLRMPWLVIACVGQLLIVHMVGYFEGVLTKFIALASFMPFIAAMGGNVGTQSVTITVRALATSAWSIADLKTSVLTDFLVGLLLGVLYGVIAGVFALALYGTRFGLYFPLIVGVGMVTSMTIAATIGVTAPFIFSRFGVDPATATGPLVTTLTDLLGLSAYLIVASLLLL
ncbi:magnesium transporter [Elusimicrobiota bacterium]